MRGAPTPAGAPVWGSEPGRGKEDHPTGSPVYTAGDQARGDGRPGGLGAGAAEAIRAWLYTRRKKILGITRIRYFAVRGSNYKYKKAEQSRRNSCVRLEWEYQFEFMIFSVITIFLIEVYKASLVARSVKNPLAMQETTEHETQV